MPFGDPPTQRRDMARYALTLVRYGVTVAEFQRYGAFRMRIEAEGPQGEDLDAAVFIYQKVPASPHTGDPGDIEQFVAVAGLVDMSDYPVDAPSPTQGWPFYRQNWFEIDLRSMSEADELWNTVNDEVRNLLLSLRDYSYLLQQNVTRITVDA